MHGVRAGCAWGQGWVVGVGLVIHGVRAEYVRPFKHAWTLEPFIF